MKKHLFLLLTVLAICCIPCTDLEEKNKQLQEKITELQSQNQELSYLADHSEVVLANTEWKELTSEFNGQTYTIKVKLPRGYESETATYPVLYVTDAETNFGGITYIVQRLIKDQLIPPMLVVGIAYDTDYSTFYKLRSRDLTPIEDKELTFESNKKPDPTGGAGDFSKFLSQELFPFIAETYRINPEERALYGHSYGGLFGAYVLLNRPELFNRYLLLSPSLWYYDEMMLEEVNAANLDVEPTQLYMASGEFEGRIDDLQVEFVDRLSARNIENLAIEAEVMDNETHRTIFGPGFTNGMRYLYKDFKKR
ncbi:MAG: alpha/beta hydrolase-fold protein [Bacteroidota bacterium]